MHIKIFNKITLNLEMFSPPVLYIKHTYIRCVSINLAENIFMEFKIPILWVRNAYHRKPLNFTQKIM